MPHVNQSVVKPLGAGDPSEVAGYRLVAKIGEGGMGAVYLTHSRGGQPVALKLIRREYAQDPDFRARFEAEVQAARRVSGYHIVPVVDHDLSGDEPWVATTYVPGLALDDALAFFGPLPLPTAFQLIGCTAHALDIVHAASVIHRDLKPSNILLGSQGPWVIDFGIARATDTTQLTRTGGFIGTPQYMSPEHALGQRVTPATDVFALGLIAAVVATGRHPYGDGSGLSIAAQIANTAQQPADLSGYPEALRPLLQACLAADPAARPTPAALAEWCRQLSGRQLRDFAGWLPAALGEEVARREHMARQIPTAAPPAAAPPAPAPVAPPTPTVLATRFAQASPPPADVIQAARAAQLALRSRRQRGLTPRALAGALVLSLLTGGGAYWALRNRTDHQAAQSRSTEDPSAFKVGAYNAVDFELSIPTANEAAHSWSMLVLFSLEGGGIALNDPNNTTAGEIGRTRNTLSFYTEFGKSTGTTVEECAAAATGSTLLPSHLTSDDLNGPKSPIAEGDVLCTLTPKGRLAMLKIEHIVKNQAESDEATPPAPTYKTKLTVFIPPSAKEG